MSDTRRLQIRCNDLTAENRQLREKIAHLERALEAQTAKRRRWRLR